MKDIHDVKGYTYEEPKKPDTVVQANVCTSCGYLAIDGVCDSVKTEYLSSKTIPTESCKCHIKYTICTVSGKLAGEHCPQDVLQTRIYQTTFQGKNSYDKDAVYALPSEIQNGICIIHTQ